MNFRADFTYAIEKFRKEAELQLNVFHGKLEALDDDIALRAEDGEPTDDLQEMYDEIENQISDINEALSYVESLE